MLEQEQICIFTDIVKKIKYTSLFLHQKIKNISTFVVLKEKKQGISDSLMPSEQPFSLLLLSSPDLIQASAVSLIVCV